jgi:hypothetical protein
MVDNGARDASKLTVPIILVAGMIGLGVSGAWWASALSANVDGIGETLDKMDRRIANVEVNLNAAFAEQRNITGTVGILQERTSNLMQRQNDFAERMTQVENWQRAVNARERNP